MATQAGVSSDRLAFAVLLLLALILPMEVRTPLFEVGPIGVTNVELVLYCTLVASAVAWLARGERRKETTFGWIHGAVLIWVGAHLVSAIFAPSEREAAVKFALRTAASGGLVVAAAVTLTSQRRALLLIGALASGAVLSAFAGLLEIWVPAIREPLMVFKQQRSMVGGFLRASGSFDFANTAAMYWEATLPLMIAVAGWLRYHDRFRFRSGAMVAAAIVVVLALVLTLSRAGLVVGVASLAAFTIAGHRTAKSGRGPALASLVVLLLAALVTTSVGGPLGVRLQSDHLPTWYRTAYRVHPASSEMEAGATAPFTVAVRNSGLVRWRASGAEPVSLSYFWQGPDGQTDLILSGARVPLPHDVEVGEEVTLHATVRAPNRPGRYTLKWDLAQEHVAWFSALGVPTGDVTVRVTPAVTVRPPAARSGDIVSAPELRPTRRQLWAAAWQMWRTSPLLGVGPDNFRRLQGDHLGIAVPDMRIHANSLYFETLSTLGVAGVASLALLILTVASAVHRSWHGLAAPQRLLLLGPTIGIGAYLLHGLVDYFFIFTSTSLLFWMHVGLLVSLLPPRLANGR